jgi:hypothetical protein
MRGYDIDGKKMNEIRMTKLEGMEGLRHAKPLNRKSEIQCNVLTNHVGWPLLHCRFVHGNFLSLLRFYFDYAKDRS